MFCGIFVSLVTYCATMLYRIKNEIIIASEQFSGHCKYEGDSISKYVCNVFNDVKKRNTKKICVLFKSSRYCVGLKISLAQMKKFSIKYSFVCVE